LSNSDCVKPLRNWAKACSKGFAMTMVLIIHEGGVAIGSSYFVFIHGPSLTELAKLRLQRATRSTSTAPSQTKMIGELRAGCCGSLRNLPRKGAVVESGRVNPPFQYPIVARPFSDQGIQRDPCDFSSLRRTCMGESWV
jgi:hypothetical protein